MVVVMVVFSVVLPVVSRVDYDDRVFFVGLDRGWRSGALGHVGQPYQEPVDQEGAVERE
jgi:hypothetical protein